MPVYKFNDKANKVQPEKLESTEEESDELYTLLEDKLSGDDKTPSLKSVDESTVKESHEINADSISLSYEMIDGTTVYFESSPSVQPSLVSEVVQATALPNVRTLVSPDSETVREGLSSNKNTFINNKELPSKNDASSELEGIKLDTQKQTSSDVPLENPEIIISSTLDTVSKDDISALDKSSKSEEELLKNIEHTEKSDNVEDNEKEKVTESEGIFASITKTLKILSNSVETVVTESMTTQSGDDTTAPEAAIESDLQLEDQVPKNTGVEDAVTEQILSPTQIKLDSSIDQSIIDKEKVETQQQIIHESVESAEISDEKIKKASTIILESTSTSDVPSSNNFVNEDADKPAKELSTASLILANDNSANADVTSHIENIQIQETNEANKVMENTKTDSAITSYKKESTVLSNLQETVATKIATQNSNEQKLSESDEAHLENAKKDADHKETINQADKIVIAEISETTSLPSESIATESFPESQSVNENIAITEKALNHSANIQFNKESIVHSNVNKNDDLVNDTSANNVPIESNEFLNDVKSSVLGPEQSIDSSQKSMISEQTMTTDEFLKKQVLLSTENLEHKDSKLFIN